MILEEIEKLTEEPEVLVIGNLSSKKIITPKITQI